MKATELRIGNWVNPYDQYCTQVTGITNTGKIWLVENPRFDECAWLEVKPIPLTEEWLLKFGFEEFDRKKYRIHFGAMVHDNSYFEVHRNTYIAQGDESFEYWQIVMFGRVIAAYSLVDYIHQVQNLYFALTGEELNAKQS